MEIKGKITQVLAEKTGQSANGSWRKQEYVLETDGLYSKNISFIAWGDKIDQFNIKEGEYIVAYIDLESREYNGRWYTDVKAWKVSRSDASAEEMEASDTSEFNDASSVEGSHVDDDVIPF